MPYEHIELSRDGHVATLRLNRPETRNAMTIAMGEEVQHAAAAVRDEGDVRVLIVTGAGKAFSAGGDLAMLAHAIGAGLCFALACDMRIAASHAKLGMTFTKLGLHPGMGGTYLLPRLVGTARACELVFSGRVIDALEAERVGIVNRVVPQEALLLTAQTLAREIAAAGPVAVRLSKRALSRGVDHSLADALDLESLQQAATFQTEDAKEGIRAVMEKRAPQFTGR
jgi:enoyl-CoA hydratase/carnithine racemase